ncbi:polypeptide N-acetylgalactosaminyltransferase 10 [Mus musculus]|uniref:Polypeptide N-acetylgalactosaminyltransferase 10 n=4 Tax=Mus musculus TaxID=10090 RepID=GLT10_MOUSE|nr:polypeptide N-acetylgalactosaminyltransferase 10 [Mus musculus]Q6P9S7.1 RecName: Full=Polypeptide N-acetylgalactosaminyltransferase 10; AltName: Full=Polypeptide GalNAc transferase 10; Short=GalNAc-T10; Short=pp-GaNTase 10; AltName: Full=Protein-UDP acetylgalactosaminyltransferase 10; AltName: Full=UDP-GalNAc:polypeptide N-acetylgalactosaminyltransferase 10 [Mus musculus]AAH60617.1 UDP-N-acetyl-alpha-D-galactosamine:polypeptide N-acetylgalactosaminyltransferase 10 [Mus musculus]BAE35020.1 unn|eukprot:NP_598950.2 polypeptide N-acetylgalactosaminyltransferase 10 [Mus musculus]
MRRKEKRLLQAVALALAALVLLPNVGLWALYRERQPDGSPGGLGAAVAPAAVQELHSRQKKTFFLGAEQRLKDWHNKEAIRRDAQRVGYGEQGKPYPMTDAERVDQAYRENGFNIYVSDKISLNRSLPDIRHPNCNSKLYLETLPNTSIIIPFHNEGWSSLLRTVHSVLNRSPPELVAEIVLVDDFSDREHLKKPLEDYMALFPSVRILRTKKREGLIRTRMLGASAATGDVVTFLDSHCEANVNWLPPLLDRIARNRKTIVCPMIDVIDHDDFRYETQAGDAMRGAFDWEMYYKRIPIPPELQKADPSDPFESPVMAGGLFAVDRKWFWELGGYDPGLEIWGGEQYEISFKVWMCGGRMEDIPCSRVGHIYRKYVPYKVPAGVSLARNLKRVAEVWMDEYAEYIYQRRPEYRHLSAGDVVAQKKLRVSLNCKSFKWFMTKIAWDLPKFYPPVEPPAAAWGEIRNVGTGLCTDTKLGTLGSPLRLETCIRGRGEAAWNSMQVFTFTWREDIRPGDPQHTKKFCFDAVSHTSPVTLYDCHSMKGNQLWKYRKDKTLYHPVSGSCMDCSESDHRVFMNTCNPSSLTQQWLFEHTNSTVLENFNKN